MGLLSKLSDMFMGRPTGYDEGENPQSGSAEGSADRATLMQDLNGESPAEGEAGATGPVVVDLSDDAETKDDAASNDEANSSQLSDTDDDLDGFEIPPVAAATPPASSTGMYGSQASGLAAEAARKPADSGMMPVRTPKNRQELLAELQRNYAEVVTLVRKVDTHLDQQDRRSQRMLEIAESIPGALENLTAVRAQNEQLTKAVDDMVRTLNDGNKQADESAGAQLQALGQVRSLLENAGESERRVAESLDEFRSTIGDVASSTQNLGDVLETISTRESTRDEKLANVIQQSQRSFWTALILAVLCLAGVVVIGIIAVGPSLAAANAAATAEAEAAPAGEADEPPALVTEEEESLDLGAD
ncbi:MAG: hypothetical protein AAF747_04060 [Planctomycetota bacterium]